MHCQGLAKYIMEKNNTGKELALNRQSFQDSSKHKATPNIVYYLGHYVRTNFTVKSAWLFF